MAEDSADIDPETDWYGPDTATFGDRLAGARDNAGMTQKDLAGRLGVQVATLNNWEHDVSEPRANRLSMMAGLLNVSIKWLLTGEGDGLADPLDDAAGDAELTDIANEMRDLQDQMQRAAERAAALESRLRARIGDVPA